MRLAIVGGSDAGISAALRARELDPDAEVTVAVAVAYPNFSILAQQLHVVDEHGTSDVIGYSASR